MDSLNSLVAYYQNTGLGLGEIVKRLSVHIYSYPRGKLRSSEDDCGDFYLFFYPRLLRTLRRFREQGKPFEWYFNSVLRWHYRAYCRQKRDARSRAAFVHTLLCRELPERTLAAAGGEELHGGRTIVPIDRLERYPDATWQRRMLFLALKNARDLDDCRLRRLSQLAGVEEQCLIGLVERLRAKVYRRELRLHGLYRRQNKLLFRIYLDQRSLNWEVDPMIKSELALRLCRMRSTLRSVQRKIRRVRLHPSNREIAEVLKIPKGTVDTSLFWLRRSFSQDGCACLFEDSQKRCA